MENNIGLNDTYSIIVQASFDDNVKCVYNYEKSSAYILFYLPRLFFTFILPVAIIVIANVAIIFKVRSLNIIHGSSTGSADVKCNNIVLFVIPIVFITLNLPFNLRSLLKFVLTSVTNDTIYQKYYTFYSISFFLYCFNFSTNFIIYALASSMFRKALVQVCCKSEKKSMPIHGNIPKPTPQKQHSRNEHSKPNTLIHKNPTFLEETSQPQHAQNEHPETHTL
uniref:G-protein coupled receptors family 1 profile domain-containing protein n=1 Tax=Globodera rostochiensis TaxID=31243 RepID=A0A914HYD7_GLORO